jgi:CoA:oxalate CoA-transferase
MIAIGNNTLWQKFCVLIEREELRDDPRFQTNALRTANHIQLRSLLNTIFLEQTTEEWRALFDQAGIPNGPINNIDQVVHDPQIIAREMIVEIEHPLAGETYLPGIPIKLSETPGNIREPAPLLGEHTAEIFQELLGYDPEEVQALREQGVC